MALQHPRYDFVRGDTWKIYGKMQDDRGQVLPVGLLLTLIKWGLIGQNNVYVVNPTDADITAVDADQGDILITVDEDITKLVPAGRYTDFCWIDLVDGRRTKWFGEIWVQAGPPAAP